MSSELWTLELLQDSYACVSATKTQHPCLATTSVFCFEVLTPTPECKSEYTAQFCIEERNREAVRWQIQKDFSSQFSNNNSVLFE